MKQKDKINSNKILQTYFLRRTVLSDVYTLFVCGLKNWFKINDHVIIKIIMYYENKQI